MTQQAMRYPGGVAAPRLDPVGATVPIYLSQPSVGSVLASEIADGDSLLARDYIRTDWEKAVVWVVQEHTEPANDRPGPGSDPRKADKFGIRKTLLDDQRKPADVNPVIERLRAKLTRSYNPGVDYLLATGEPLMCSLAFALAINIAAGRDQYDGFAQIQVLHWNDENQDYEVILIPVDKLAIR